MTVQQLLQWNDQITHFEWLAKDNSGSKAYPFHGGLTHIDPNNVRVNHWVSEYFVMGQAEFKRYMSLPADAKCNYITFPICIAILDEPEFYK